MSNETKAHDWTPDTHNGECTVLNPATGQHRTFRVRRQASDASFAPGERLLSVKDPGERYGWRTLGFVSTTGLTARGVPVVEFRSFRRLRPGGEDHDGGFWLRMAAVAIHPERFPSLEYQAVTCCRICNRKLTDPDSIAHGVGPTCAENHGLLGERAAVIAARRGDVIGGISRDDLASDDADGTDDDSDQWDDSDVMRAELVDNGVAV